MKRSFEEEVQYRCPISHEIFVDPVDAEDGKMYERWAIKRWVSSRSTSPLIPSISISIDGLRPNGTMKDYVATLMTDEAIRTEWLETRTGIARRLFKAGDIPGAAALEYPIAMTKMALKCQWWDNRREKSEYIKWVEKASAAGEKTAMHMHGDLLYYGHKEGGWTAALEWYKRAADLGDFKSVEQALRVSIHQQSMTEITHWTLRGLEKESIKCQRVWEVLRTSPRNVRFSRLYNALDK